MAKVVQFVIIVLLSVIVLLIGLLHHYYLSYKRLISIEFEDSVFDDLIPSASKNNRALSYLHNYWPNIDDDVRKFNLAINSFFLFENENYSNKPYTKSSEAVNCLHAAMLFKQAGKLKKAKKILEHAAIIAPDNPDVLNIYGEFLEQTHKDVVTADELYSRALVYSPQHEGALENRKRTAPVVDHIDMEMFKAIDRKRDLFKDKMDFVDTVLKREAYYLHIYHTVSGENWFFVFSLKERKKPIAILGEHRGQHFNVRGITIHFGNGESRGGKEYNGAQ